MKCNRCGSQLEADLRREFATLRHLGLLRGRKQGHQVFIAPF
jgi:hypothetical protein